jgi:hypothetical protein
VCGDTCASSCFYGFVFIFYFIFWHGLTLVRLCLFLGDGCALEPRRGIITCFCSAARPPSFFSLLSSPSVSFFRFFCFGHLTNTSMLTYLLPLEPSLLPRPTAPFPSPTRPAYVLHARLLSWFLDAPAAPFGVHRMALAGKAAGKDVGMWFGPNAAAGALRFVCFLHSFVCFWAMGLACRSYIFFLNIFAGVFFTLLWCSCRVTPCSFLPLLFFLSLPPQSFSTFHALCFDLSFYLSCARSLPSTITRQRSPHTLSCPLLYLR